jgi:hypothetical protein
LLASGTTITEAAKTVGVSRPTVSEWLNHHPAFQATLNSRRQELWTATSERLRTLLPKALDVLEAELEGENRLSAAVHLLKAAGAYGLAMPQGPVDVEEAAAVELERQKQVRMARLIASA